jgi:hypothetical protein
MNNVENGAKSDGPLGRNDARHGGESRFVIGRGRHGGWIVNDRLGLTGGIFISEAAARHYAFEESGGHYDQFTVLTDADYLELDIRKVAKL